MPSATITDLVRSDLVHSVNSPREEGRAAVPEHRVKALLRDRGIDVPNGIVLTDADELANSDTVLREPLVLKAFGSGIVHKSDLGAVQLGVTHSGVSVAVADMRARLRSHDITPAGFLLEEQHHGGIELIVGVVRDATFGHVVLLGLGGVATELLDLSAVRVAPLTRADAVDLVAGFPGAPLLFGARGNVPVDTDSLVELLLRIAGDDGLIAELGSEMVEFECNPVVVDTRGAQALDARLIIDDDNSGAVDATQQTTDFTRLFAPGTVAVAGASATKSTFGNRFLAAYRAVGRDEDLCALHPTANTIDEVRAFPSIADLPERPDYIVSAVPAAVTPELVADAARSGVPFVHVITGGFAEMGPAGAELQSRLQSAVSGTSTRLLGPNCLGVFNPRGRQAFTLNAPTEPGTIGIVSQSGGLSGDMITVGNSRGLRFSKLVSVGNAIDVSLGELVDWLVTDPETDSIGIYLEGTRDGAALLDALRRAQGVKPVVILRGGSSEQGSAAVASHTGSLATGSKIWEAVCESTSSTQVRTLEQFLSCLLYLQSHRDHRAGSATGVLVVGLGGGASVLATDACDRAGLVVTPIRDDVRDALRADGFGAGTSVGNPLEVPAGPASAPSVVSDAVRRVIVDGGQRDFADALIHLNIAAYFNYGTEGVVPLLDALRAIVDAALPIRVAVVIRNVDMAPADAVAALRDFSASSGLPVFFDLDEAATAIAAAQRSFGAQ